MSSPFRIEPAGPVEAYKTFQVVSPADVMVPAACEAAACQAWAHGWETTVDERTDLGMMQATYIRQRSGRTFTEHKTGARLTVFRFEPRQRCFAEHQTRPQRHIERGGDWRGTVGGVREHTPEGWQHSFEDHQGKLAESLERG